MSYASATSVSVEKTEGEIKAVLRRYGATAMASFEGPQYAVIAFEMNDRRITMRLPLPDKNSEQFKCTPTKRQVRSADQQMAAWEQACRSRWRGLFLCIKAKLESVESGIETFEDAFLAHIQLPNGQTVSDLTRHAIKLAYDTGEMQPLLPAPGAQQ